MSEPVTIEVFLECYKCGAVLKGKSDTDQRILVKPCQKCMDRNYMEGYWIRYFERKRGN